MRGGKGFAATTLLIVLLVVAVAGMGAYIFVSRNAAPQAATQEPAEKRSVLVTEDNIDEVVRQTRELPRSAGSYTASMNSEWHFPDGKSPSTDAYVGNSNRNKWPVWFGVTLEDGRTVYESPILPVDTYLREFALDEELEAGSYNATVTYHLVDEDQKELSTLSIGIMIVVES